jgi:hypothetical protein
MEFKHIAIQKTELSDKTYIVFNKHSKEDIGRIYFYSAWKKYVFEPDSRTIYDKECLNDISLFIRTIENEYSVSSLLKK